MRLSDKEGEEANMSDIKLQVTRGEAGAEPAVVSYDVPYREGMSLLDAIFWIREHRDPSLTVRYSCRSANACKECTALVDGKAGFLCSIRAKAGSEVRVEPLKGRPWIRDLATELD
ncbi:2Fe-2S iron-sulfur cluster-binding protein [Cohnella rhizosphaerae]|uniref:2Fe-2S iron-sulfur cluster-binding protein n=1 Tax=Cohnella rhizosphaerae TaxID=1457232 RepID=A0A9X4KTI8_9BACL|nr:2Fe-2S iron-sulfur cluster-binding protein [Cohnella rhizosphaerae]MDG0810233.1 2Fe-2S iron-sulfur cluster-binding protein [Cohnella rhizosphaerae]